jgi:hypothetical protein
MVDGESSHDPGEPGTRIVDCLRALAPPEPRVSDHVLGIGPAGGEPVRDAVQVRPQLVEDGSRLLCAHVLHLLAHQTTPEHRL